MLSPVCFADCQKIDCLSTLRDAMTSGLRFQADVISLLLSEFLCIRLMRMGFHVLVESFLLLTACSVLHLLGAVLHVDQTEAAVRADTSGGTSQR